jgi:hypothetical protein
MWHLRRQIAEVQMEVLLHLFFQDWGWLINE